VDCVDSARSFAAEVRGSAASAPVARTTHLSGIVTLLVARLQVVL
jgi:hypothetical protein